MDDTKVEWAQPGMKTPSAGACLRESSESVNRPGLSRGFPHPACRLTYGTTLPGA